MYGGQVKEAGETEAIFASPAHPYTAGLIRAVPRLDEDHEVLPTIDGEPPNMLGLPPGCPFSPRCGLATERCVAERPVRESVGRGHSRACFAALEEVA